MKVNALLDDASTKTYVNADVAAKLGLNGKTDKIMVNVLNGRVEMFETKPVSVELKSITGNVNMNVSAYTANRVTGNMRVIDWNRQKGRWIQLENIDFPRTSTRQVVDVLVGLDCAELHCAIEKVRGRPGEPIARRTPLGWTCIGHPDINCNREISQTNFTYFISDQSQIENLTGSVNQLYKIGDVSSYIESIPKFITKDISAVTNR